MWHRESLERYVCEYAPKVEELTGTDLGNVTVGYFRELAKDIWEAAKRDLTPEEKQIRFTRGQREHVLTLTDGLVDLLGLNFGRAYLFLLGCCAKATVFENGIYLSRNPLWQLTSDNSRRYTIVHELFHIAQGKINGLDGLSSDLRKSIEEGYAEYSSLVEFAPHYGKDGMDRTIRFRKWRLYAFPPNQEGFIFFSQCARYLDGRPTTDILRNPPQRLEELRDVEAYVERIFHEI